MAFLRPTDGAELYGNLSQTTTYTYDVFGNRIAQSNTLAGSGVTTNTWYINDGANVALELTQCGESGIDVSQVRLNGAAVDQVLAVHNVTQGAADQVFWLLANRQGTVLDEQTLLTNGQPNPNGTPTDIRVGFSPSGKVLTSTPAGGVTIYAGMEFDTATGLFYDHARFYNAVTQRFINCDPLGLSAGDNEYEYCGDSPTNATDPTGCFVATTIGTVVGGVTGFFAGGFTGTNGWDWSRAWAGAGSGALIGAGIGLAIDTLGTATPLSMMMVGAGIGAGIGSAAGGGLLTSGHSTNWSGWGKGVVVGGISGAVAGYSFPMIGAYTAASSTYVGAFAAGAGSAILGDVTGQLAELGLGWRDAYSPAQTFLAGATGGVLSMAARGLGQVVSYLRYQQYLSQLEQGVADRTLSRAQYAIYNRLQRIAANGGLQEQAQRILDEFVASQPSNNARAGLGAVNVAINRQTGLAAILTNGDIPGEVASSLGSSADLIGGVGTPRTPGVLNGSRGMITLGRCAEFRGANSLLLADTTATLDDIVFSATVRGRSMPMPVLQPCFNCRNMFGLPADLWGQNAIPAQVFRSLGLQINVGAAGSAFGASQRTGG